MIDCTVRYVVATVSVVVALLATLSLHSATLESPLFFLAVILSAWYGGVGPGLFASALSTVALSYFFVPPLYSIKLATPDVPTLLVFLVSGALVSVGSALRSRALAVIRRSRDDLEAEVASRTATLREQAALLDLTHDTIVVRDMRDVIRYWNRGAAALYGWTADETVGRTTHAVLATVFPQPLAAITAELRATGRWEGELIHTRRDGTTLVVASRWALQRDAAGNPVAILETNNDVTLRRRAEDALRESERRYRRIFEGAGVSIWEGDFSAIGTALDGLSARGVRDVRTFIAEHPEFVRQAIGMATVSDVNESTVRLFGATNKAELLGALDRVFVPETEELFRGELIALAEGRPSFASETVLQTLAGDRLTVLLTITFPAPPAKLDRVLGTIMDITERKRAEEALQKAHAELAHVTRVTTLGELAASIAHEIKQPLAAMVADASASLNWLAAPEPNLGSVREALEAIVTDGHRAADVIHRIRDLAKHTDPRKTPQDLNQIIEDVILLLRTELHRSQATVRIELTRPLPAVLGDRVQLQQVLINLIVNGIEAMALVSDRARHLVIRSEQHDARQVAVTVTDSGVGISPRDADRLFDAFFTTKSGGMGMGLSISRTIIEGHGGRLSARANADHGATFQFILPPAA